MSPDEIKTILADHAVWLLGRDGGKRANLRGADLIGADLYGANLRRANLRGADLRRANLRRADLRRADLRRANLRRADLIGADLYGANLSGADLSGADLSGANLSGADLYGADLIGADLYGADLYGADLSGVIYDYSTAGFNLACPEVGAFHAFKKCRDGKILELLVTENAKRSSATTRKIRFSEAIPLSVSDGSDFAVSLHDGNFIYRVGELVTVEDFDDDRWNECSRGIHGFLTRHEAETWEG